MKVLDDYLLALDRAIAINEREEKLKAMPKCKCGLTLEEGMMGILWCPKHEDNWEIPEGLSEEEESKYYCTVTRLS